MFGYAVPGAATCHVLLRPTAAPQWTERIPVKNTSIELPQSMDNYFIGVATVVEDGSESLPSIATPISR